MKFNDKYTEIKKLVKTELEIIEEKMVSQINMREPLKSYIINFLKTPSKRIRSVITILYLKSFDQKLTSEQLNLLTAIELVHNASLIHDDVIDNSQTRRSHKTLSAEFDNKLAIISGDYILSAVMEILTELNSVEIISKFSKTIKQMCIGEINQNFDRFKIGTIEDYIEKTKNKTAYLFETALLCSILLNNKNYDTEKACRFALDVGIAFQIRDDLLNIIGHDNSKPTKNDIEAGIYTAPIIFANNIENYHAGIEKTRVLLNNYIESAGQNMQYMPENEYKIALKNLLELLRYE